MSVSRRTPPSKEVMAVEAIKGIVKVMVVLAVDTADMATSIPQQVLLPLNHLHQVHPEPPARQITVHNTPNIMVPVARIPTQPMVVIRTIWRIINTTRSKPHSNQLHRELPLLLHRAMILRLHPLQPAPLLPLMGAIILWVHLDTVAEGLNLACSRDCRSHRLPVCRPR